MITPNEIKSWVDMLLSRRPNVVDRNYLEAIKHYMDKVDNEERKTGYWRLKAEWHNQCYYGCSNCGREISLSWDNVYIKYPKCPYCNADMKEKKNE